MLKRAFSALVKGSHANRKFGFKNKNEAMKPKRFFLQEREGLSWFRMLYIDEHPLYYSDIYSEEN